MKDADTHSPKTRRTALVPVLFVAGDLNAWAQLETASTCQGWLTDTHRALDDRCDLIFALHENAGPLTASTLGSMSQRNGTLANFADNPCLKN